MLTNSGLSELGTFSKQQPVLLVFSYSWCESYLTTFRKKYVFGVMVLLSYLSRSIETASPDSFTSDQSLLISEGILPSRLLYEVANLKSTL